MSKKSSTTSHLFKELAHDRGFCDSGITLHPIYGESDSVLGKFVFDLFIFELFDYIDCSINFSFTIQGLKL